MHSLFSYSLFTGQYKNRLNACMLGLSFLHEFAQEGLKTHKLLLWWRHCFKLYRFFFFGEHIKSGKNCCGILPWTPFFFWDHIKIRWKLWHFPLLFWNTQNRRSLIFELTPGPRLALGAPVPTNPQHTLEASQFTLSRFITERQARKIGNWSTNFYSPWFDPIENRTQIYRCSIRHSINSTTNRLILSPFSIYKAPLPLYFAPLLWLSFWLFSPMFKIIIPRRVARIWKRGGAILKEWEVCKRPWLEFSLTLNQLQTICPKFEMKCLGKIGNSKFFRSKLGDLQIKKKKKKKKRSSPKFRVIFRPKSTIQSFFRPKLGDLQKKKKKVFAKIQSDFSAEIQNSNVFSAQN